MLNPIGRGKLMTPQRGPEGAREPTPAKAPGLGGHQEAELQGLKPRKLTRSLAIGRSREHLGAAFQDIPSTASSSAPPSSSADRGSAPRPSANAGKPIAARDANAPRSRSSNITRDKQELLDKFQTIRQHFATLLAGNWSPGEMDDPFDQAMLPAMIAAENHRTPQLKLTRLPHDTGLTQWLEGRAQTKWFDKPKPYNERVMFTMPGFAIHQVVADVKQDRKGNISVLVVEPLGFKEKARDTMLKESLPILMASLKNSPLGKKTSVTVLALDTQKSDNDCRIFGLSAASKMADQAQHFEALHEQNLAGSFKTSKGQPAQVLAERGRIKIIEGKDILPFGFVKHSQSLTTLEDWQAKNQSAFAHATVNKKGQTLTGRFDEHKTSRHNTPLLTQMYRRRYPNMDAPSKPLRMGTSIEEKRLEYIDRAERYLANLSEEKIQQFIGPFDDAVLVQGGVPDVIDPRYEKRKHGPDPDTL